MICPCGSQKEYTACCELYISGKHLPPNPEALMRSRYTAFTLENIDYLNKTMTRPKIEKLQKTHWLGLKVISAQGNFVEFMAYSNFGVLHEISEFKLINNQWFYIDGKFKT